MSHDVLSIMESLAEHGHAPKSGCTLFGVGYDDAFARLKKVYLERRFERGSSAEKFVVGPYGSGKTHFLRQLLELAAEMDCVTIEVSLHREIDFTDSLLVFSEITREIKVPGSGETGLRGLLVDAVRRIRTAELPEEHLRHLVTAWLDGVKSRDFKLKEYGRILHQALSALAEDDMEVFELGVQWLSGDFSSKSVCRNLAVSPIVKSERNVFGIRAMLSLFQFIRQANYPGTVLGFDEAEQSFNVDRKKRTRILSLLQSGINAITDLDGGSALVVFGLTNDVVEEMMSLAALQQRVADPAPGQGFFDGNTYAPKIDLTQREDPEAELVKIGGRLVTLFYDELGDQLSVGRAEVEKLANEIAHEVAHSDVSSSNRRTMVKRIATTLMHLHDTGALVNIPVAADEPNEDEI